MARVLDGAGLGEEARAALLQGLLPLGRALALEQRFPEPDALETLLLPPLAAAWREALPVLREYTADATKPLPPLLEALGGLLPNQA